MDKAAVVLVQTKLAAMGLYTATIDGDRGPKTHAAVAAGLPLLPGTRPADIHSWSEKRQTIAFLQLYCHSEGIDAGLVDGWWGPQTDWAAEALAEKLDSGAIHFWRDIVPGTDNPNNWPTQAGVTAFYGPHGAPNFGPTPPPPLVNVEARWEMKIAWDKAKRRRSFRVHQKVAESLGRVLDEIARTYSTAEIDRLGFNLFGGDYNARKIRGGTSWSMHSWGIAIDFDPEKNQLRWGRDRATLAHPDCIPFWEAWEREGWVSLGRLKNFDWMHVQAAKLN